MNSARRQCIHSRTAAVPARERRATRDCGSRQGEKGDEGTGEGAPDEGIQSIQVGHEVRRHRAASETLVLGHRDPFQALDQPFSDPIDDVFADEAELAALPNVQQCRYQPEQEGDQEHSRDVQHGTVPFRRGQAIDGANRDGRFPQQDLVNQQRHQQGDRHADHGAHHRYRVRGDQLALLLERNTADVRPVETTRVISVLLALRFAHFESHQRWMAIAKPTTRFE